MTSKCIGVGKRVKMIKHGNMSILSGESNEKCAILYTSAHLEESRVCHNQGCNDSGDKFTDKDMQ